MQTGMSPLRSLQRNTPKRVAYVGQDHADSETPSLSASSPSRSRPPLCPIQETAPKALINDSFSADPTTPRGCKGKPAPKAVFGLAHAENEEVSVSSTPEKIVAVGAAGNLKSKYLWFQHQHQHQNRQNFANVADGVCSGKPKRPPMQGDGGCDYNSPVRTPRRSSSLEAEQAIKGVGSAQDKTPRGAKTEGRCVQMSNAESGQPQNITPKKSVSRALKYAQSSAAGGAIVSGGSQQLVSLKSTAMAQAKGGIVSSQSAFQSQIEPYFELEEDSSFWKDHNVQVLIRTRPLNSFEISQCFGRCIRQESAHSVTWIGHPESRFTFDHVACEALTQERLFKVAGLPMVENCMSGYNSCIFAYGQTGSGKTHTMLGDIHDLDLKPSDNRGMTPRVFEYLFVRIMMEEEARKGEHLKYACKCSFLEIYNEQITDLLEPSSTNLQLREDVKKGVYVENLKEVEVTGVHDVILLLLQGAANRKVAATNMNRESSRSHSVFTCVIESKWEREAVINTRFGRLNLVDLAGSERQKTSGAEGDRLREAANINKSLSTLGLVIMILVDVANGKQRHVPYRDSKLTFLLQDSLGGNSKTMIVATVSPSNSCSLETLSTLKFAQRAKFIQNNAVVNEDTSGDVLVLRQQIQVLKEELNYYKRQIERRSFSFHDQFKPESSIDSALTLLDSRQGLQSSQQLNKEIRELEAVLAGTMRREQAAESTTKRLAAQIEQLNSLVRQREDDTQCGKMMLRFREDKIRRLESLADGLLSADEHLKAEKEALMEELQLVRSRIDRNPELTRFAMENIRLMEQLGRYQDFYDGGEREIMAEEISNIRDRLLELLDKRLVDNGYDLSALTTPQKQVLLPELAAAARETELLRNEADNYQKEMKECRHNLNSCLEENAALMRQVDDLQMKLTELKQKHDLQQNELNTWREKAQSFELEHEKNLTMLATLEAELKMAEEKAQLEMKTRESLDQDVKEALRTAEALQAELQAIRTASQATEVSPADVSTELVGQDQDHEQEVTRLQKELSSLECVLKDEQHRKLEVEKNNLAIQKQLEDSNFNLQKEKTVVQALEDQQLFSLNEIESLLEQNRKLSEDFSRIQEKERVLKRQVHCLKWKLKEHELQALESETRLKIEEEKAKGDCYDSLERSHLELQLEQTKKDLEEAKKLNSMFQEEKAWRFALEKEMDVTRTEAATETATAIANIHSELLVVQEESAIASEKERKALEQVENLDKELNELKVDLRTILLGKHESVLQCKELDIQELRSQYEAATSKLLDFLNEGDQALNDAAHEMEDIVADSFPDSSCSSKEQHLQKVAMRLSEKQKVIEMLQKKLQQAFNIALTTETKFMKLREESLAMVELQKQENEKMHAELLKMTTVVEEKLLKIDFLQSEIRLCDVQVRNAEKKADAAFIVVKQLQRLVETSKATEGVTNAELDHKLKEELDHKLKEADRKTNAAFVVAEMLSQRVEESKRMGKCAIYDLQFILEETEKKSLVALILVQFLSDALEKSKIVEQNMQEELDNTKHEKEGLIRFKSTAEDQINSLNLKLQTCETVCTEKGRQVIKLEDEVKKLTETISAAVEHQMKNAELEWRDERNTFMLALDEAKLDAAEKASEAAALLKKFEDGKSTLREAELLLNALIQANETAKCDAQGWKDEKERLNSLRLAWLPERDSFNAEVRRKEEELSSTEKDLEAAMVDLMSFMTVAKQEMKSTISSVAGEIETAQSDSHSLCKGLQLGLQNMASISQQFKLEILKYREEVEKDKAASQTQIQVLKKDFEHAQYLLEESANEVLNLQSKLASASETAEPEIDGISNGQLSVAAYKDNVSDCQLIVAANEDGVGFQSVKLVKNLRHEIQSLKLELAEKEEVLSSLASFAGDLKMVMNDSEVEMHTLGSEISLLREAILVGVEDLNLSLLQSKNAVHENLQDKNVSEILQADSVCKEELQDSHTAAESSLCMAEPDAKNRLLKASDLALPQPCIDASGKRDAEKKFQHLQYELKMKNDRIAELDLQYREALKASTDKATKVEEVLHRIGCLEVENLCLEKEIQKLKAAELESKESYLHSTQGHASELQMLHDELQNLKMTLAEKEQETQLMKKEYQRELLNALSTIDEGKIAAYDMITCLDGDIKDMIGHISDLQVEAKVGMQQLRTSFGQIKPAVQKTIHQNEEAILSVNQELKSTQESKDAEIRELTNLLQAAELKIVAANSMEAEMLAIKAELQKVLTVDAQTSKIICSLEGKLEECDRRMSKLDDLCLIINSRFEKKEKEIDSLSMEFETITVDISRLMLECREEISLTVEYHEDEMRDVMSRVTSMLKDISLALQDMRSVPQAVMLEVMAYKDLFLKDKDIMPKPPAQLESDNSYEAAAATDDFVLWRLQSELQKSCEALSEAQIIESQLVKDLQEKEREVVQLRLAYDSCNQLVGKLDESLKEQSIKMQELQNQENMSASQIESFKHEIQSLKNELAVREEQFQNDLLAIQKCIVTEVDSFAVSRNRVDNEVECLKLDLATLSDDVNVNSFSKENVMQFQAAHDVELSVLQETLLAAEEKLSVSNIHNTVTIESLRQELDSSRSTIAQLQLLYTESLHKLEDKEREISQQVSITDRLLKEVGERQSQFAEAQTLYFEACDDVEDVHNDLTDAISKLEKDNGNLDKLEKEKLHLIMELENLKTAFVEQEDRLRVSAENMLSMQHLTKECELHQQNFNSINNLYLDLCKEHDEKKDELGQSLSNLQLSNHRTCQLEKEKLGLTDELNRLKLDLANFEQKEDVAAVAENISNSASLQEDLQKTHAELDEMQKMYSGACQQHSDLENELLRITLQLQKSNEQLTELEKERLELADQLRGMEVTHTYHEKKDKELVAKLENKERDLGNMAVKIEHLENQLQQSQNRNADVQCSYSELSKVYEESENHVADIKLKLEASSECISLLESEKLQLANELQNIKEVVTQLELKEQQTAAAKASNMSGLQLQLQQSEGRSAELHCRYLGVCQEMDAKQNELLAAVCSLQEEKDNIAVLEKERLELESELQNTKVALSQLELRSKEEVEEMSNMHNELQISRENSAELRHMYGQVCNELDEKNHQLDLVMSDLQNCNYAVNRLSEEKLQLTEMLEKSNEDLSQMQKKMILSDNILEYEVPKMRASLAQQDQERLAEQEVQKAFLLEMVSAVSSVGQEANVTLTELHQDLEASISELSSLKRLVSFQLQEVKTAWVDCTASIQNTNETICNHVTALEKRLGVASRSKMDLQASADKYKLEMLNLRSELDNHNLDKDNRISKLLSEIQEIKQQMESLVNGNLSKISCLEVELDKSYKSNDEIKEQLQILEAEIAASKERATEGTSIILHEEIDRQNEIINGLEFDIRLLQESAVKQMEQKNCGDESGTTIEQLGSELEGKRSEIRKMETKVKDMEQELQKEKEFVILLKDEIMTLRENAAAVSRESINSESLFEELQSKNKCLEEELESTRHVVETLEVELLDVSSHIEHKITQSLQSLRQECSYVAKERDQLQAELLVVNEQLEMAHALLEERELLAAEARRAAEMSKTHAEEKEAEVKLLEESVEELQSTVNALENQVGMVKREAEMHRLAKEDLEMELQSLKHQMQSARKTIDEDWACNVKVSESERRLEEKDVQLMELARISDNLNKVVHERDSQIKACKGHILELKTLVERQAAEHQRKIKALEALTEQGRQIQEKSCNMPSTPHKSAEKPTKPKGSGSPFKCIGLGFVQQMNSEMDEELVAYKRRIEELERIAAARQKEVFMLNAKLAEAESMTHDVVRDLLGVKMDITNYASMLNQQEAEQQADVTRQQIEEAETKEGTLLKAQLDELIAERESWLEEINRRQAEMVAARVAAEKLRLRDHTLTEETEKLKRENSVWKKQVFELEAELNKLSGQQNLQQRIHHHAKIKDENKGLRFQLDDLRARLRKTEVVLGRVSDELARYRIADGKNPHINVDEEQTLRNKLQEAEDDRMQIAQQLSKLCARVIQVAGISSVREVDLSATLDALQQLQNRLEHTQQELSDLKFKSKIAGEKKRLSELRALHSPCQTAVASSPFKVCILNTVSSPVHSSIER